MATYLQWRAVSDPDAPAISFNDGAQFLREHAGWPAEKSVRLRTEAAAMREQISSPALANFCKDYPPISGRGMIACMRAGANNAGREDWLHQAWVQGDFSASEETDILRAYGTKLTRADHINRMDRLLYEGKVTPAKRMMNMVPADRHPLYEARMALISDAKFAQRKVFAVPVNYRRDPGLLFDRANWRVTHHQEDQVAELVLAVPSPAPYPDLWWPLRAIAAREALAKRDPALALKILNGHGELKSEALADALWLKGWILLQYQRDAGGAYKEFYRLYTNVGTPVSKARAAYWAGRAAMKNGNPDIAREWMEKAAAHPTVFYGQLAHLTLTPEAPLRLPPNPHYTDEEKDAFDREEMVMLVRALARDGDTAMRDLFLTHMGMVATKPSRFALLADLAREVGDVADGVRIAKLAMRKNVVMIDVGWPRVALPENIGTEPALALAITRQESEFDAGARSNAGAQGMMQLLPTTAKHIANQNGLPYDRDTLSEPNANITLGTSYLGQMISGFDGSYILGIASYNAGPGNVRQWLAQRGSPPKSVNGAVDWIEAIPFAETRNYVMRALENVQIYRTLAMPTSTPQLTQDLAR